VDLVRFELTTSSMPFKKYQSLTSISTENKRLSGRPFGRQWTPQGDLWAFWTPRGLQRGRVFTLQPSRRERPERLRGAPKGDCIVFRGTSIPSARTRTREPKVVGDTRPEDLCQDRTVSMKRTW
jgi:hypothetical protein